MSASPDPSSAGDISLPAGHYDVDTQHSRVRFRAKAFGLMWVNGHLPVSSGHLEVTESIVRGSGELAADAIDTGLGARDWHLRSSHYLHTAEHPRIRVELDQITVTGAAPTCAVTVRGRTHPVILEVTRVEPDEGRLRIALTTTLDRTAFPMLPPVAGVSRIVAMDVDLVAHRR
jgi:polyisoprenoid-binding protein YceI